MRFGVALPTCVEGMVYPIPFGDHTDIRTIAIEAERLGFDSLLVNDHLSTQNYVRSAFASPPRYYEPLVTLSWIAAVTEVVRLMTGVVVLPMRDPVLLAKQVACLDHMSGGRVTLGVGVGGYREEFEAVRPRMRQVRRSQLVTESIQGLRVLFEERRATLDGEVVAFDDVEMYPKPLQTPLPIYSSGNADATLRRAAKYCDGWMPAGLPSDRLHEMLDRLQEYTIAAGRDPNAVAIAPQLVVCLAGKEEDAHEMFRSSQVYEHLLSLRQSTLKGLSVDEFVSNNLIGTPAYVRERVEELGGLGVSELAGLILVANTPEEMLEQMRLFSEEVIPGFHD